MSPSRPHDKYFRRVFSNTKDAASLLRACVPEPLARVLRWSTLTLLPGRFVSPDWRDSQADLLFSVEREPQTDPVLLYVLLESATRLMRELYRAAGFEEVAKHVEYVLATQPDEYRPLFGPALRRNVPGRGGDVMNYVEQLIERGRRER